METPIARTFPALRARMGDRWYYVTTMTFAEVAKWVRPVNKIHERAEFKTWLQRQVKEERKSQIAEYLRVKPQRFFNAVVVGIYGGEPEWFPVTVENSKKLEDIELGERQSTAHGMISISGNEEIFDIDGQHRVEGIREALKAGEQLANEELAVIFVAHKTTAEGRERTRRLFTTLNKYAKPVSQAELIALNDDDTFAAVTRRLIDEYCGLSVDLVPLNPTANLASGDKRSLTSVITLYKVVRALTLPPGKAERKILEEGPLDLKRAEAVFVTLVDYWDALKKQVPEIAAVCAGNPSQETAGNYRTDQGGHLLLRPVGLECFTRAVRVMMDRGVALKSAVETLSKLPMTLGEKPWLGVLWKQASRTMLPKNAKLAIELILYLAGQALILKPTMCS